MIDFVDFGESSVMKLLSGPKSVKGEGAATTVPKRLYLHCLHSEQMIDVDLATGTCLKFRR